MSVNIRIMQKGFFRRKKFIIDDLVKLSHLSFGVMDENCQLIPNQIGDHTILFDHKYLQRGIEIYIQNHDICLNLSLPTSMDEIHLFYYLVKVYCEYMDTDEFVKDDWLMNIKDIDLQMVYDKRTSADALMDLKSKLSDHKYFEIFLLNQDSFQSICQLLYFSYFTYSQDRALNLPKSQSYSVKILL